MNLVNIRRRRRVIITFVVAGAGAVIVEHMVKPTVKGKLL